MQESENPFIKPENYFHGYQENIEKLKNDPSVIEFDKLCYELFEMQDMGKKFMEHVTNRYLLATAGSPDSPTFAQQCMWSEGVRYAFLLLRTHITSHKQRIVAGK